ncbi:MAG TPA: polysaccharide biosynthesis tyrosine autokinase, partial [Noviherbaspirillum sp.]|uniref:polysaccharide biosynthesis tyrosine autokinase n=1 Tax=Noviherbaspirillum sp. TaxID=1926288 RepID=UPI002DDCA292
YLWGMEQAGISVFNVPARMENEEFTLTAEPDGFFNLRNEEFGIDVRGKVGELMHVRTEGGVIDLRVDSILAKPGGQFTLIRAPRFEMIAYLQESLKIAEKGKQSGIISVVLESKDPKLAGNVVDEIGREYIRQNEERKSRDAEKSLIYLNTQLPELKSELEQSESRLSALRNKNSTVDLSEEGKTLLQQAAATQTKLFELKQKKAELLTRFNNNHPSIDTINQLMRGATTELAKLDLQAKRLPSVEQELLRVTRDVKVNTEVYTAVLGTAQQLRLIASSNVGNARLLDAAAPPLRPVSPRRLLLIALAGAVGLVLGVLFAFVRKTMFGRVDYPHEVEQLLGFPVSATIYHSKDQKALSAQIAGKSKELAVLSHDGIPDHAVESLRNLRSTLQFAMLNARNNIIMITGPTPGVGKSFVSANLTALLASIGKRVLLIDADLRTGYLHRYFGVDRENGLAEAIRGDIDVDSAVHRSVVEKVDFIATGKLPGKAAELLEHPNFALVLARLSAQYDFVLIDTPPVLPFSDASIVGTHAGAIFNIVRGGVSTVDEIDEAVKRLSQSGSTVTGTVFNDPKSHLARARFGARYGKYRFAESK